MQISAIVGYDGSPAANAAIEAGASLFPNARGWVTYLWGPPFASAKVRRRLRARARDVDELVEMVEYEGEQEAHRLVAVGVTLARTAGWEAEPLLRRTFGNEGLRIAQIADELQTDLVCVGCRGLGGTQAVLGSVSDMVVHYASRPVLVVPYPMLAAEHAALAEGPVAVGWDGSAGAETAFAAAGRLFPERDVLLVSVDEGGDTALPAATASTGRKVLQLKVDRGRGFHARTIYDALIGSAREHNAAVVVVGSRGRSAAREILLGSVAMGTLHHSHRPVLVVPSEWGAPPES